MGHTHDAEPTEYYLDQLCSIALGGAFAGACITLYTWQRGILDLILAKYFHIFVLWGGIALLVLVLIRAVALWISVGKTASSENANHVHNHHHDHDHDHDHAHCHDHDHAHEHEHVLASDADHVHAHHSHDHNHNHDPAPEDDHGHEHGWAPWRYVVLLLPIMLYILQLPNEGFSARDITALDVKVDPTQEAVAYARLIGPNINWASLAQLQGHSGPARELDFKMLEQAAKRPDDWRGENVSVRGQYIRQASSDKMFTLARFKITCCAADVIPLRVAIVSREPVTDIGQGEWVKVTGQLDFQETPNGPTVTILRVPSRKNIVKTQPDANPYVQ
jgi:uncharacterized repeat protein (TIGR03943 family)